MRPDKSDADAVSDSEVNDTRIFIWIHLGLSFGIAIVAADLLVTDQRRLFLINQMLIILAAMPYYFCVYYICRKTTAPAGPVGPVGPVGPTATYSFMNYTEMLLYHMAYFMNLYAPFRFGILVLSLIMWFMYALFNADGFIKTKQSKQVYYGIHMLILGIMKLLLALHHVNKLGIFMSA